MIWMYNKSKFNKKTLNKNVIELNMQFVSMWAYYCSNNVKKGIFIMLRLISDSDFYY